MKNFKESNDRLPQSRTLLTTLSISENDRVVRRKVRGVRLWYNLAENLLASKF
jgi:hypothetical protein